MKIGIVLFSGGLDSTACLYWAKARYDKVILLSFIYGSKEDSSIIKTNSYFTSILKLEKRVVELPFLAELAEKAGSTLSIRKNGVPIFEEEKDLDNFQITEETARSVWVPGRNIIFLSIAAALGDTYKKPVDIIFGANKEEGRTFPDNTPDFIERMNRSLELGCQNQVKILGPFQDCLKKDIVLFLIKEQAKIEHSSSCYDIQGWTKENLPIHCGSCESCQRRKRAFSQAKAEDKTVYSN